MEPAVRSLFAPSPGVAYLDTASYGLPPAPTVRAWEGGLEAWRTGRADWLTDWDQPAEEARTAFGRLLGVGPNRVALLPAVSVGVGIVAAGLAGDDEVVVVGDDEFASLLFPLLVAESQGVTVHTVPFDRVAEAIGPGTRLVATSLVQMHTGRLAPLQEIIDRAEAVGARVLVDATQGVPFVSLPGVIDRIDYLVCAAYKHLLCPRGVAFMVIRAGGDQALVPWNAGWRAADRLYSHYFGRPLDLAGSAARFDVSLAWHPWIAGLESLRLLVDWAEAGLLQEPLDLAAQLAASIGVGWEGASLVCVPVEHPDRVQAALRSAGVKASVVSSSIRFSTHVYNDAEEVDRAAAAIDPFLSY